MIILIIVTDYIKFMESLLMGAKHTKLYSTMFVVGGCELPLEKNPYATIDVI
jgi:hypothetical protein